MWSNNRTQLMKPYIPDDDSPLPKLFDVKDQGLCLPARLCDTGSDIKSNADADENEDDIDT